MPKSKVISMSNGALPWVVKSLLAFLSFYIGIEYGKRTSLAELKPCKTHFPRFEVIETIDTGVNPADLPHCNGTKVYNHCIESPYSDNTFMHLAPGTIPETFFPNLHHPASPAKWSFIITQDMSWPSKDGIQKTCQQLYLTRTGSRASQPNKCVAVVRVPEGVAGNLQHSHRTGYTALLTDQYLNDYARPYSIIEEQELLPPMLKELPKLKEEFLKKMGNPLNSDGTRRAAIVMVANEGVMDLVLNFICSAESSNIDLNNIVVFVGTQRFETLIENMGGHAMYSPALGSMPSHAAYGYLDKTFSRMMWFKVTSVYLALSCGFDVLFQDVDLVWMKDPIPYLRNLTYDISFMDDGARTPRYTPFFVNSGFYFMKYNQRTLFFQEKMMKCGPSEIGYTHSHQSVLIRHIAESYHFAGLSVNVLDMNLFPSGQAYHEKKNFIKKIMKRSFTPFVFHMCW